MKDIDIIAIIALSITLILFSISTFYEIKVDKMLAKMMTKLKLKPTTENEEILELLNCLTDEGKNLFYRSLLEKAIQEVETQEEIDFLLDRYSKLIK